MDHREQQELVSAYLDGEVTPQERTAAEGMLEASPELRRDLDDFARLSELIRALPQESAPPDLAASVRREAEQQLLVGPESALPRRSLKREWLAALAGMAVTAAAMLVTIQTLERHAVPLPEMTAADTAASAPASRSEESMALVSRDALSAGTQADESKLAELKDAAGKAFGGGRLSVMAGQPGGSAPADAAHGSNFALNFSSDSVGNSVLNGVRIGDMLQYLEQRGDQVAVVELQVVDVLDSLGQIEVLLSKHQVSVVPSDDVVSLKENLADKKLSPGTDRAGAAGGESGELTTVFLDTSTGQVDQLFEDMSRQKLFVQALLQPPVEVPARASAESEPSGDEKMAKDQGPASRESDRLVKAEANEAVWQYSQRQFASQAGVGQGVSNSASVPNSVEESLSQNDKLPQQQAALRNLAVPMRTNLNADLASQKPEPEQRQHARFAPQKSEKVAGKATVPAAEPVVGKLSPADQPSAPESTVRLLLVLRQAGPAATPKE